MDFVEAVWKCFVAVTSQSSYKVMENLEKVSARTSYQLHYEMFSPDCATIPSSLLKFGLKGFTYRLQGPRYNQA